MRTILGRWAAVMICAFVAVASGCNSPAGAEPASAVTVPSSSIGECNSLGLKVTHSAIYTDDGGHPWIVGTISNTSKMDLLLPRVCIKLTSAGVSQETTRYIGPMLIKAGESVAFHAMIDNPTPGQHYSIGLTTDAQSTAVNLQMTLRISRNFQISKLIPTKRLDTKDVTVSGTVTNTGRLSVNNIYVSIGLFDKDGALAGVAAGKITGLESTPPGAAVSFQVTTDYLLIPATDDVTARAIVEGQISTESDE